MITLIQGILDKGIENYLGSLVYIIIFCFIGFIIIKKIKKVDFKIIVITVFFSLFIISLYIETALPTPNHYTSGTEYYLRGFIFLFSYIATSLFVGSLIGFISHSILRKKLK